MYRAIYYSCATLLLCLNALAQTVGQPVRVVPYPTEAPTRFLDYDGSNNLIYVCATNPVASQSAYSLSVTGATLTSIVVLTNVGTATTAAAHGLQIGQSVVVSGSTTGALNATYKVATTPSTTTFTIATAGVADGTYNNGPLTISGTAPLLTGAIWAISKLNYSGSNLVGTQCPNGTCGVYSFKCSDRAILNYK